AGCRGDLLVARKDLDLIGLEIPEEGLRLLLAPDREQAGSLRGGRSKERFGNAALAFPPWIDQVRQSFRTISLGHGPRVDQQDPGTRGKPKPVAVGVLKRRRNVLGVPRPVRLEQTSFLEADGVEDLIVPEQVATGLDGLGD